MKWNKSILLILLLIVVGIFILSQIFLKDIRRNSHDEYLTLSNIYEKMADNIKNMKLYEKQQQELLNEINRLSIMDNLCQEEIINLLSYYVSSCNIDPIKITFSEVRPVIFSGANNSEVSMRDDVEFKNMSVNIEFTSTYDQMLMFIKQVQENENVIDITDMRILNTDEGEGVYCVINLNFYGQSI